MYRLLFYGGMALFFLCMLLSIVFFIKNNVAGLLSDVIGCNAKKAVKKERQKGLGKPGKKKVGEETQKAIVNRTENDITTKCCVEKPMPVIFNVEEEVTVVHTAESIGFTEALSGDE